MALDSNPMRDVYGNPLRHFPSTISHGVLMTRPCVFPPMALKEHCHAKFAVFRSKLGKNVN